MNTLFIYEPRFKLKKDIMLLKNGEIKEEYD